MTVEEHKARKERSAKLILWFAMISMFMMFAGLTSAFLVSKGRADWIKDFQMPTAFYASTAVILTCSFMMHWALVSVRKGKHTSATGALLATFLLGLAFFFLQFQGFRQIIQMGYYFTGQASSITTTFLYVVALVHLAHVLGGMISLLVIIYNHFKQKYKPGQTLGIELGATYWHFLDFLWLFLFLFLSFFK
ncbi:heme-copper oxidase subunit III [Flavobacterium sp. SE-s28]|uniref:Heme-copper oxidase subunit III n=2 Tax=Flavobacterium silvaticum TaxID=1852020 RepID=A0A972FK12_9FLAO|nr:heme-copper oxidase subunit III [Flavobacterium silvaticum]